MTHEESDVCWVIRYPSDPRTKGVDMYPSEVGGYSSFIQFAIKFDTELEAHQALGGQRFANQINGFYPPQVDKVKSVTRWELA